MKQDTILRIALWLVEVNSSGPDGEAFAGDLMELFATGRSRWWCLAQALRRTMSAIEQHLRSLLVPLWYSIGFVLLYPQWQRLYAPSVVHLLTRYRGNAQWPGSAVLEMTAGLLPSMLFVGLGILVYLLLRRQTLNIRPVAALLSLNVGVCLLFLAILVRLDFMEHDLRVLSRTDFYYPLVHARFSILLFLSLFGAVAVLPRGRRPSHRRRHLARLLGQWRWVRVARSLEFVFLLALCRDRALRPQDAAAKRLV